MTIKELYYRCIECADFESEKIIGKGGTNVIRILYYNFIIVYLPCSS